MNHWLMKSEPEVFGIDEFERVGTTCWEGVRNYQARNLMRDGMKRGDLAFFYHSSCAEPAIVGIMGIVREAYPDPSQFDRRSPYSDPDSPRGAPRWVAVDVRLARRLKRPITLQVLRTERALSALPLLRRGNRLSVMPVTGAQWQAILRLE
jgi:predicted RNA-binding protein with PUA-like domain